MDEVTSYKAVSTREMADQECGNDMSESYDLARELIFVAKPLKGLHSIPIIDVLTWRGLSEGSTCSSSDVLLTCDILIHPTRNGSPTGFLTHLIPGKQIQHTIYTCLHHSVNVLSKTTRGLEMHRVTRYIFSFSWCKDMYVGVSGIYRANKIVKEEL